MIDKANITVKRCTSPTTTFKLCGYKAYRTSNYDGGVVVFIKKRFLGFLWWTFKRDLFGNPITFNHETNARALMEGKIGYYDQVECDYKDWKPINLRKRVNQDAYNQIIRMVESEIGETPELDCVIRAWELEGCYYCHRAVPVVILWHRIYKQLGKKIWEK